MLNKRLDMILSLCDKTAKIADVGCDHAFLSIALIKQDVCQHVYASDVAKGPLAIASSNVKKEHLDDKIDCILSDGIVNIPKDVNAMIIAGMGYYTAKKILEDSYDRLKYLDYIIVQINSDVNLFREWLSINNCTILEEKMVYDRKYYTIIKFNMNYHDHYSLQEITFGPKLLEHHDPIFVEYYQKELEKYQYIYSKITNDDNRKNEVKEMIEAIKELLIN